MTRAFCLLLIWAVVAFVSSLTCILVVTAAPVSGLSKAKTTPQDPGQAAGVGRVLIAQTVDAETSSFDPLTYQQDLNLRSYIPGGWGFVPHVLTGAFRNANLDSYGNPMKITWFLLSGEPYCQSQQHDCAIVHTSMEKYKSELTANGDLIGWHYHNWGWTDDDTNGEFCWNELMTFNGRSTSTLTDRELAEKALAYLIIEKHTYPTVFRSGWSWENNEFSLWLDDIEPFDFSNLAPMSNTKKVGSGPNENLFDWHDGPVSWTPYHPSATNYQQSGDLKRWQFHSSNEMREMSQAFHTADSGNNVLITHYTHTYNGYGELDFNWRIASIQMMYPRVKYQYVTALEGARIILGLTDTIPPSVVVSRDGPIVTVTSNEPLFSFPYGAVRTSSGYFRIFPIGRAATRQGNSYSWTYRLNLDSDTDTEPASNLVVFGGCDPSGNSFVTLPYSY